VTERAGTACTPAPSGGGALTDDERAVVIEASHPSRPDREALLVAAVERILAARAAQPGTPTAVEAPNRAALDGCGHPNHGNADHDCGPFAQAAQPPTLTAVEALADEWEWEHDGGSTMSHGWAAERLRAALAQVEAQPSEVTP
jgi:hypothetical protein